VANQYFGAGFGDAHVAIDHENADWQIGSASNGSTDRLPSVIGFPILHGARINRGHRHRQEELTGGYFPHVWFREHWRARTKIRSCETLWAEQRQSAGSSAPPKSQAGLAKSGMVRDWLASARVMERLIQHET
jgi:hypothetical protein